MANPRAHYFLNHRCECLGICTGKSNVHFTPIAKMSSGARGIGDDELHELEKKRMSFFGSTIVIIVLNICVCITASEMRNYEYHKHTHTQRRIDCPFLPSLNAHYTRKFSPCAQPKCTFTVFFSLHILISEQFLLFEQLVEQKNIEFRPLELSAK